MHPPHTLDGMATLLWLAALAASQPAEWNAIPGTQAPQVASVRYADAKPSLHNAILKAGVPLNQPARPAGLGSEQ